MRKTFWGFITIIIWAAPVIMSWAGNFFLLEIMPDQFSKLYYVSGGIILVLGGSVLAIFSRRKPELLLACLSIAIGLIWTYLSFTALKAEV